MQWDSWIINPQQWTDQFLDYDYVGAPWLWHTDNYQVGNGGFALHSRQLANFLREYRELFPIGAWPMTTSAAPIGGTGGSEASPGHRCTWPRGSPSRADPDGRQWGIVPQTFGFHACFNFIKVLDHDRLLERTRLMLRSPYVKQSGGWGGFVQTCPDILREAQELEQGDVCDLPRA